jgi:hypothetical protein
LLPAGADTLAPRKGGGNSLFLLEGGSTMNETLKGLIGLLDEKGFVVREIGEMEWTLELAHYNAIKIVITPKNQEPYLA